MIKNIRRARNSLAALGLLGTSAFGSAILVFVTQILLARSLSPSEYGVFTTALMSVALLVPLAGFGVPAFWLRAFGVEGWQGSRWVSPSLRLVFITTSLSITTLFFLAVVLSQGQENNRHLAIWILPWLLSQIVLELIVSKLQLEESYKSVAGWPFIQSVARLFIAVMCAIFVARPDRLQFVVYGYSLLSILIFCAGVMHLRPLVKGTFSLKGHPPRPLSLPIGEAPSIWLVAAHAWPFGAGAFFYFVYFQSDVLVISYMIGASEAGIYRVASATVAAAYLLPSVIYQKFLLPKIHRWAAHDHERFLGVYRAGTVLMMALGVIVMVAGYCIAPVLVPALFGEKYVDATGLLLILLVCIPLRFASTSVGATLVTHSHMRRKVGYMGGVALVNLILNIALVPKWHSLGAAFATVVSEALLLIIYAYGAQKYVLNGIVKS